MNSLSDLARKISILKKHKGMTIHITEEELEDADYSSKDLGALVLILQERLSESRASNLRLVLERDEKEDLWKKTLDHFA